MHITEVSDPIMTRSDYIPRTVITQTVQGTQFHNPIHHAFWQPNETRQLLKREVKSKYLLGECRRAGFIILGLVCECLRLDSQLV